ncbi:MAG: hypothetical protein RL216_976 [Pseudomonadota bacterium]
MHRILTTSLPTPRRRRPLVAHLSPALALHRLPPHMLRDIGVTEEEAQAEPARPLWDIPPHWRG